MAESLHDAISRQYAAYEKYFAANDMDSVKKLYTEDCRMMPDGSDTLIGNHVVPKVIGGMVTAGATSASLVADEVGPLGGSDDMVFERGRYKIFKADGSVFAVGKHVVIWKKTEDGFKLYIDIFNSS